MRKKYASRQSLQNHTNKFHKDKDLYNENKNSINENINSLKNEASLKNENKNSFKNKDFFKNDNNNSISKNIKTDNKDILDKNIISKFIQKSSVLSLQCIYYAKLYKTPSSKCTHMKSCKIKHPEIEIINNKNICNICNKTFVFSTSVYKHKKLCKEKQEQKEKQEKGEQKEKQEQEQKQDCLNNNIINNKICL